MSQPKKMRGPQQREMRNAFPQAKEVGVGAPTKRNAKCISASKGSWGWGPNTEAFQKKANGQGKLGWAPTQRNAKHISTSKGS